jgi:hypothetical protein
MKLNQLNAQHRVWASTAGTIDAACEILHGELRTTAEGIARDVANTAADSAGLGGETYRGTCWRDGARHAYADALETALFFMPLGKWREFAHALNDADKDRNADWK